MGETPRLAVVVVAYGAHDLLRRCLASLADLDVVVVDNEGSSEIEHIAVGSGARLVRPPGGNVGFAAGVNAGLDAAGPGADVLVVNPDAVLPPGAAERLHAALRADPGVGVVGPGLQYPNGSPQRSWWPLPTPWQVLTDALGLSRVLPEPGPGQRFLSGAVMLLRAEALASVGRFDERFFLYAEESDWQLRAQRAGWEVRLVGEVVALHEGAASSSDPSARALRAARSSLLFSRKWYPGAGTALFRVAAVLGAARRWIVAQGPGRAEQSAVLDVMLRGRTV